MNTSNVIIDTDILHSKPYREDSGNQMGFKYVKG